MNTLSAVALAVLATLAVVWIASALIRTEQGLKDRHSDHIDAEVKKQMRILNPPPEITHAQVNIDPPTPHTAELGDRIAQAWEAEFKGKDVIETIRAATHPAHHYRPGDTKPINMQERGQPPNHVG